MQVLESQPNLGTDDRIDGIEVISDSEAYESDASNPKPEDDYDISIAIRKVVRKCNQHPLYPLSLCLMQSYLTVKSFLNHLNTITIPKIVFEALGNKEWKETMRVEIKALEKNKTQELVKLPKEKKTMGCRWVFTMKYKANGSIKWFKARLVA